MLDKNNKHKIFGKTIIIIRISAFLLLTLIISTIYNIKDPSEQFQQIALNINKPQILDRNGIALNITYENDWNLHYIARLHDIPLFLRQAFIAAEDKRFYQHHGIDWQARFHALWQNLAHFKQVRGASTISEQVVQMLHHRPRSLWSKWLEGWESYLLERKVSKAQILEFYLNQVPFAARQRGVVQAANYYFNRDLGLINKKQMLALAVMVSAPSRLNIYSNHKAVNDKIEYLAKRMNLPDINRLPLGLNPAELSYSHQYLVQYIINNFSDLKQSKINSTIDLNIQNKAQQILENHLNKLTKYNANNAAMLIVNNHNNQILSWNVANSSNSQTTSYDPIITRHQPGSTLKPFLYAYALEKGFNAATIIKDDELFHTLNMGLHNYNNYSRTFYGAVTLRTALANSLNIPAIKMINSLGVDF